jgi:hypothetical protein
MRMDLELILLLASLTLFLVQVDVHSTNQMLISLLGDFLF